jgi:hypothetical protein
MKSHRDTFWLWWSLLALLTIACFAAISFSCSRDEITPIPPDNSGGTEKKFMFCYDYNDGSHFHTDNIGSSFGSRIDAGENMRDWVQMAGVRAGASQAGGGADILDIDKNGILDLLLMAIDDPYGKD